MSSPAPNAPAPTSDASDASTADSAAHSRADAPTAAASTADTAAGATAATSHKPADSAEDQSASNKKAHTAVDAGAAVMRAAASCSASASSVASPIWDSAQWSRHFAVPTHPSTFNRRGISKLRVDVFQSTLQCIRQRGYVAADGTRVTLASFKQSQQGTRLYTETDSLRVPLSARGRFATRVTVREGDCLEAARDLIAAGRAADDSPAAAGRSAGDSSSVASPSSSVAVLNMACASRPGGGVFSGAGAQEENLFRRSALLCAMYPYAQAEDEFDSKYADCHLAPLPAGAARYPLAPVGGCVYTPATQVFRSSEKTGYAFLHQPYEVAFLSVPAVSRKHAGGKPLSAEEKSTMTSKIRAMLRMAAVHGHVDLVLSAFGCGAFGNPPAEVTGLFAAVFAEDEFRGVFRTIVFAVFDDHNAHQSHNPEGNLKPFQRQFEAAEKGKGNE